MEALDWTGFNDQAIKMAGHWFKVNDDGDDSSNKHVSIYGIEEDVWSVNADGAM